MDSLRHRPPHEIRHFQGQGQDQGMYSWPTAFSPSVRRFALKANLGRPLGPDPMAWIWLYHPQDWTCKPTAAGVGGKATAAKGLNRE
jgi:hypothetical protein